MIIVISGTNAYPIVVTMTPARLRRTVSRPVRQTLVVQVVVALLGTAAHPWYVLGQRVRAIIVTITLNA